MKLSEKIAVFCSELERGDLLQLAQAEGLEEVVLRVRWRLRGREVDSALEDDLNALHLMVKRVDPQGLFPTSRQYSPLLGESGSSGAEWWECSSLLCSGQGRVRPGQTPPTCGVAGQPLTARPV